MRVVAQFDPPDARPRYEAWRSEQRRTLDQIPPEALKIDVGRADSGDFVRVSVEEDYADCFE